MKNISPVLKNRYGHAIISPELGLLIGYIGDEPIYESTQAYTVPGEAIMDVKRILMAEF
jgi:hypothetical protein